MFKLFTLSLVTIAILTGCSDSKSQNKPVGDTNTTKAKKVVYGDKTDIDISGIGESSQNINCQGEVALRALNNQFMTNAYDWKIDNFKTISTNPTSTECEVRHFGIDQVHGIFGQELVAYKISKENNKYSIAMQENNGIPIAPSESVALDYSCGGTNARTLIENAISSKLFDQIGTTPQIAIDSIVTENKNNYSTTCNANVTVFNPDENAPRSESVLSVENIHYQIMKTDDKQSIIFKRL